MDRLDDLYVVRDTTLNGRPAFEVSNGRVYPYIMGGDGSDPAGGAGAGGGGGETTPSTGAGTPTGGAGDAEARFTQAELNRIAAQEKAQGERAAERRLLETLGVTDAEEAKKVIEAAREAERQKMDEATRAKADAEAERAAAAREKQTAAEERTAATIERALIRAGCPDETIADVALLVKVEGDVTLDAAKAAVEQLKSRIPALFTASAGGAGDDPGTRRTVTSSAPAGGPPATPAGGGGESEGARRAKQRWAGRDAATV